MIERKINEAEENEVDDVEAAYWFVGISIILGLAIIAFVILLIIDALRGDPEAQAITLWLIAIPGAFFGLIFIPYYIGRIGERIEKNIKKFL